LSGGPQGAPPWISKKRTLWAVRLQAVVSGLRFLVKIV